MERKTFLKSLIAIAAVKVLPIESLSLPARSEAVPLVPAIVESIVDKPGIGGQVWKMRLARGSFSQGDIIRRDMYPDSEYIYQIIGEKHMLMPLKPHSKTAGPPIELILGNTSYEPMPHKVCSSLYGENDHNSRSVSTT